MDKSKRDGTRCILTFHAHPDDESSKGPATIHLASKSGVRTVLVCATGGEEGDILNPALNVQETKDNLADIRRQELFDAASAIGYSQVYFLGYRDSGMQGTESNNNPLSFNMADLDEASGRLVEIIRKEKPQVVISYGNEQQSYPHPDHIMTNKVVLRAFEDTGDPTKFTQFGPSFQPLKLYFTVWAKQRILEMHETYLRLGLDSPFDSRWLERPVPESEKVTTQIDISSSAHIRREALLAHKTQIDPNSKFWFGLPPDVLDNLYPYEDYHLYKDLTNRKELPDIETDLFDGIL